MLKLGASITWEGHLIAIENALSWRYLWMVRETSISIDGIEMGRARGVKSWQFSDLHFLHEGQQCKLDLQVRPASQVFSPFHYTLSINGQPSSQGKLKPASRARYAFSSLAMFVAVLFVVVLVASVISPGLGSRYYHGIQSSIVYRKGRSAFKNGQFERALDLYWHSVELSRKAENRRTESIALAGIGETYLAKGQPDKALAPSEQSFSIARNIELAEMESFSLIQIGQAYAALNAPGEALEYYIQARTVLNELDNWEDEALVLALMATAYGELGQLDEAERILLDALAIAEERNDEDLKAAVEKTIACVTTARTLLENLQSSGEMLASDCPQFSH